LTPLFSLSAAIAADANAKETGASVVFVLMEKKQASVADLIDTLLIFKGKNAGKISADEKIKLLTELNIITGSTKIYPEKNLNKGFAALLFHRAMDLKGGAMIGLAGRSRRSCLQDMIYLKIMPDSSEKNSMSGPELISLLTKAKEYMNTEKAGIAVDSEPQSETVKN